MRVGIDARAVVSKQPSGIGFYLINILSRLAKDTENEYYLYSNEEIEYEAEYLKNFNIRIIPGKIGTLWLSYQLRSALYEDKIEVFWGTEHMLPLNAPGIKKVVTVHDLSLLVNPGWGSFKNAVMQNLFVGRACKAADVIMADSAATQNDLVRILKVREEKISVVYPGHNEPTAISAETSAEVLRKYGLEKNRYFVYVGTLEPRKNIVGIVRAYNILREEKKLDYKLVLAGKLGWKTAELENAVDSSPWKSDIILPGYISNEEKAGFIKNAAALLFPSHYEGFGMPVLEAMSYGTPVITRNVSSLPEIGGELALYCTDDRNLSELMYEVSCYTEEKREQIKNDSLVWVRSFDWDECAEKTKQCIESLGRV